MCPFNEIFLLQNIISTYLNGNDHQTIEKKNKDKNLFCILKTRFGILFENDPLVHYLVPAIL